MIQSVGNLPCEANGKPATDSRVFSNADAGELRAKTLGRGWMLYITISIHE